jgi:hypothetical protein
MKQPQLTVAAAMVMLALLGACAQTTEKRAATGGLGGAAVGGPVSPWAVRRVPQRGARRGRRRDARPAAAQSCDCLDPGMPTPLARHHGTMPTRPEVEAGGHARSSVSAGPVTGDGYLRIAQRWAAM